MDYIIYTTKERVQIVESELGNEYIRKRNLSSIYNDNWEVMVIDKKLSKFLKTCLNFKIDPSNMAYGVERKLFEAYYSEIKQS